jgi:hypothetical protein
MITTDTRSAAARLLRRVATDEHAGAGARLHCLSAADLLDPTTGPLDTSTLADPGRLVRDALRRLAGLPAAEFTAPIVAATVHARQALRELDTGDGDLAV